MILAILQARMSSSRLPGKVMKPVLGRPMIAHQMQRIARARRLDRVVLATSREPSDDSIVDLAGREGWLLYRGELADVLGRFLGAAQSFGPAEHVVRLTADCPLTDPNVIDRLIELHVVSGADYSSNSMPGRRTFPDGLDAEIVTMAALERAAREANSPTHREHVTPYLYEDPTRFRLSSLEQARDLGHLRWTVDTAKDLAFVEAVFDALHANKPDFVQDDVLALLEQRPEIARLNS